MSYEPVTAEAFAALEGLGDWRYLLGAIEAEFVADTFAAAGELAARIAAAADEADHHPDLDVRYPGRVRVVLTTHAVGSLTDADVTLARTISGFAAEVGARSDTPSLRRFEIAIDTMDVDLIRPFWAAVLGYDDDGHDALVDPVRLGPAVWFQQMDVPRPDRNRIHLDVTVPHDEADDRIAAALAAGGVLVDDGAARAFWVLADAEGNEACVCTWQDRGPVS